MPALETLADGLGAGGFGIDPARAMFLHSRPHAVFAGWGEVTGWQPWRQHAVAWEQAGHARVDVPGGRWPVVLALPGKSRDETLALFATAHDLLEPGGLCIAAMPNDCGAGRFEKELAAVAGGIESIQKRKCRVFLARRDAPWDDEKLAAWRALSEPTVVAGTDFSTVPGIFSAGRVDAGSALLVNHLPASLRGRVADLGAGWGFLSHAVMANCTRVEVIDLYEADARALAMARGNLTEISVQRPEVAVGYHWHDVAGGLPVAGSYDAVVMNPPFHDGRRTEVSLGEAFLAAAAAALKPGGILLMVANRQLPYEAVLGRLGMRVDVAVQDATYKVLRARR